MDLGVDLVLVLTADRDLQLVARRRQMKRAADVEKRACEVERQVALKACGLDLGLLAQPLGLQQGGEHEPQEEDDDAAAGRCETDAHQKRK
jgi:hypothetical protein